MFDAIRPREFTEPKKEAPKYAYCSFERRFLGESETRRSLIDGRLVCNRDGSFVTTNF